MKRVIAYVDGFNLYFGLKSKGWQRYFWLNISKLAANLLHSDQEEREWISSTHDADRKIVPAFSSDDGQSQSDGDA